MTFEWKDYAGGNRTKIMTLDAVEFIRRFLLHILPRGFVRIRQFGFLANRVRKRSWSSAALCSRSAQRPFPPALTRCRSRLADPHGCPICRLGRLIVIELLGAPPTAVQDTS